MKLVAYGIASFWEETLQTVEKRETLFQVSRFFPFWKYVEVGNLPPCKGQHVRKVESGRPGATAQVR
ncbi:hypothetical protein HJO_15508 [Hyphomonas johnsonii MHS-2]|jgi:hypothetical protein|uniref:Uncharacterized protein n=1 Tax=Hyphomonas johnsonii MHS-2 TaxID=1280950 RepID=A0A059FCG1_9PROT|nr:hypothetical protein HJO_15508 [Hyphomonas johnsonii MHS-2]